MDPFSTFRTVASASGLILPQPQVPVALFEKPAWSVVTRVSSFPNQDIDEFRAKFGKANGEREFFDRFVPDRVVESRGNLLMYGGASLIWECLIGNGTATSAQPKTFMNGTQGYLGVGDTSTAEAYTQTDLAASSNKYRQVFDAGYPLHSDGTTGTTISAATNASPIQITSTSHGLSTGNIAYISGVGGNTAANGLWQVTVVDANNFTLNGSTGSAAYTSGGLVGTYNVLTLQATFGTSVANYAWNEWGSFNASSGGKMFNRKVASLGTKTSSGSMALKVGIALG